jgi:hypothetical protein
VRHEISKEREMANPSERKVVLQAVGAARIAKI